MSRQPALVRSHAGLRLQPLRRGGFYGIASYLGVPHAPPCLVFNFPHERNVACVPSLPTGTPAPAPAPPFQARSAVSAPMSPRHGYVPVEIDMNCLTHRTARRSPCRGRGKDNYVFPRHTSVKTEHRKVRGSCGRLVVAGGRCGERKQNQQQQCSGWWEARGEGERRWGGGGKTIRITTEKRGKRRRRRRRGITRCRVNYRDYSVGAPAVYHSLGQLKPSSCELLWSR